MSIGSNIKRLRREKEITQEQLAEYLGITSRAISQWECDRTAPDISQIPALCHIFAVSSDVLLGIDVEKNEERIKSYLEEAHKVDWEGNFEKEVELLREALGKFPRSYQIMQKLANALVNVYSRKGIKDYEEVFSLCNRVLAECTDSTTRYEATQTLVYAYDYAGKKEEMLRVAEEMPKSIISYESCMLWIWEGDADFAIHMDTYDFEDKHTSPVLRGYSDGGFIPEAVGNTSQMTLDWLLEEEFDVLRTGERFEMFAERLKEVAKKP